MKIGVDIHFIDNGDFMLDGGVDVHIIDDGDFMLDGGIVFGPIPKSAWETCLKADRRNRIRSGADGSPPNRMPDENPPTDDEREG